MTRRRPRVVLGCVADRYATRAERIVEFTANDGTDCGGLISLRRFEDGTLRVDVYRCSGKVVVVGPDVEGAA